jgi:hypothetical protein
MSTHELQRINRIYRALCKRKYWIVKILQERFNLSHEIFDDILELHYDRLMVIKLNEYELANKIHKL